MVEVVVQCKWTNESCADEAWAEPTFPVAECHCSRCYDAESGEMREYDMGIFVDVDCPEWKRLEQLLREWQPPAHISNADEGFAAAERFERWIFDEHRADYRILGRDVGIFNYILMCYNDGLLGESSS